MVGSVFLLNSVSAIEGILPGHCKSLKYLCDILSGTDIRLQFPSVTMELIFRTGWQPAV